MSSTLTAPGSEVLPCMAVWQEAVDKPQAKIQQLTEELDHHVSLVDVPRQLMRLAANEALQQVPTLPLPPRLYFTLSSFMAILQEAFVADRFVITFKVEGMTDDGPAAGAGRAWCWGLGLCFSTSSSALRQRGHLSSRLLPQLQQPAPCCALTCAALLKLAHLSHLERRAKILWCSSTAGPSGCFQKH